MSPYESSEISKDVFIAVTNQKLADAMTVGVPLQTSIEAAKIVIAKMDEIEKGVTTVEPPLSELEQHAICGRAHDIVSLGERAVASTQVTVRPSRMPWRRDRQQSSAIEKLEANGSSTKR